MIYKFKLTMKKSLLFLFTFICVLSLFTSCKDDEPEIPPTIDEVIGTYTADKLSVQIDGKTAPENATINIVKEADNSTTIKLANIVPGIKEFAIPNATFEAITRSSYVSKLTGSIADEISGYNVTVDGTVDKEILTVTVTISETEGVKTNVKGFYNMTFKGNMAIDLGMGPVKMAQRIYVSQPKDKDSSSFQLKINNFSFEGMSLGDITLDTIRVVKRGSIYGFKAENRKLTLAIGEVSLNVRGAIVDNHLMKLSLLVDASPLTVDVQFEGDTIKENPSPKVNITIDSDVLTEKVAATSSSTFKFKVWESTPANQLVFTPKIEIFNGGTLDSIQVFNADAKTYTRINENTPIDFSQLSDKSYVKYFIKAQDIRYQSTKLLYIIRIPEVNPLYTMDKWVESGEPEGMASSNDASALLPIFGITVPKPVSQFANENTVQIITLRTDTANMPITLVPAITAGTMFTGSFSIDMTNTLKSTKFGIPYRKEPATFKITYKYTPGPKFYKQIVVQKPDKKGKLTDDNEAQLVEGKTDECSINAYLYEVASFEETLDGTNVNTSNKVILKAILPDGTATSDYKTLEIPFTATGNGTYDPAKKYKLAIVCSSSKDGDVFEGAPESALLVKHLEVTAK